MTKLYEKRGWRRRKFNYYQTFKDKLDASFSSFKKNCLHIWGNYRSIVFTSFSAFCSYDVWVYCQWGKHSTTQMKGSVKSLILSLMISEENRSLQIFAWYDFFSHDFLGLVSYSEINKFPALKELYCTNSNFLAHKILKVTFSQITRGKISTYEFCCRIRDIFWSYAVWVFCQ